MLKIQEEKVRFLNEINIGMLAYVIDIAADGYESKVKDLVVRSSGYDNIVFKSVYKYDVLDYNSDIVDFYKQMIKINPYVNIYIFTNGKIRPNNLSNKPEMNYIIKLKCEDLFDFNDKTLQWFGKQQSFFIIKIRNKKDIKKINTYIQGLQIKKSQIYIDISEVDIPEDKISKKMKDYALFIKTFGFNFFISFEENEI